MFYSQILNGLSLYQFIIIIFIFFSNIKNREGRQYIFAVFENQSEEVELYRPNRAPEKPTRKKSLRQSFDNPMYGSNAEVKYKIIITVV